MKALTVIKFTFAGIGLVLLVFALIWAYFTSEFIDSAQHATGKVTELVLERSSSGSSTTSNTSYVYRPRVQFTSDSGEIIEFISSVGSNPASFAEGEIIEVLYDTEVPHNAQINSFFSLWFGPLLTGFLGVAFSLIGRGIILFTHLKTKQNHYLRIHGSPIITKFDSIIENRRITYNNRHPFQIITQWQNPITGKVHIFKSNNIWYDPTQYIEGKDITVFINRDNPDKHLVDLSFLPELAD
ncbi:DUF3592 domain-containing protein [Kiloniella sp.]|uniref:DUF3592 domain-containing protein n=1 Tax=Kiloniella sp. TaxID=1938587 RepID=UPI003B02054C